MNDLDDIYSRQWFEGDFRDLGPEFDLAADGVGREFGLNMHHIVIDIGCGPGMMLESLQRKFRCGVWGIEGSRHGVEMAEARCPELRGLVRHQDIREIEPGGIGITAHLAICTEVAEHLDDVHAPRLVAILASLRCPVVWTAAPPGQDGHHHVNCKPPEWWRDLFAMHGMRCEVERTQSLTERWRMLGRLSHMRKNLLVWS